MKTIAIIGALCAATLTFTAQAQNVDVKNAWARATVQGQMASGAFLTLTAKAESTLVAVSSPVAGVVELHEMKMDGDVMKMRAVQGGVKLVAGKPLELKPGGYHVMLMDLKMPLRKDTTIPLSLVFKDAKGVQTTQDVRVPVQMAAPAGASTQGEHKH
jgi:copper(I)-binding protein